MNAPITAQELCAVWSRAALLVLRRAQVPVVSQLSFSQRTHLDDGRPIAYQRYVRIETGAAKPKPSEVVAICDALPRLREILDARALKAREVRALAAPGDKRPLEISPEPGPSK
jgi:hypothetical protein